jgi:hypothetical protein
MTEGRNVFDTRLTRTIELAKRTRKSLRLWRWIFYTIGSSAVVAATAAGASNLADIWGAHTAGLLALLAAVLTAVEKFLTAGGQVNREELRWESLDYLQTKLTVALADVEWREAEIQATQDAALQAEKQNEYEAWLQKQCAEVDDRLARLLPQ